jgi:hypothetical protein
VLRNSSGIINMNSTAIAGYNMCSALRKTTRVLLIALSYEPSATIGSC